MSKQHQVVIKFTGNTTQAEAAMRKLKTETAAVGAEITKVDNTVKKAAQGFINVSQVTIKSTASLNDLKHAIRGASTGIIEAGATLDQYKIKTTDLRTRTLSAAEAAKKAAVEQARYNKLMNQGAIDAQRLAAATARAATAASATANANALAAIRQGNASTVGVGTAARASATVANAGLSTQAAALRLQSQQAAAAAASAARLQRQQDMQAASAARAAQHALALAIAQARQQAAADRAALAAQRLADANNRAGRSSQDAGGMHGLSAKHVLTYSAAYMSASAAILGFLAAVASVPQLGMKLQATESGLLGVYKNQALVNEQLGFLSRLADEAGVKVTTLRDAYTKFTASAIKAGTTVEDAQKQFENYTKTARALNLNDQDFQGMLTAIQQILSKGRIMSEELQGQLGEHIPAAVAIMAKSIKNADGTIGVTTMELRKMMEQGQLTSLEMQQFSDILFNEFSQGYAASINNLSAETARFSNAWDEVAVTVFKATEGIMADVVKLSTGALHQLNETLQTTTDYITALDGKQIRFSVEPKVVEDLGFIERALTNIEGLLDKSASGWASAFSKWGASFDKLKASMDFGLGDALLGNTADQFRDYEKITQNVIQANAALSEGFKVLQKGTDKQAITLKDELAVALRNYNQQAAEMLRQMEQQETTIANLNKSGQSSTGETARLAESKKSYEDLMVVITNYADLFVRTNQKIGNASNEAKAALNAEAKTAADGVRAAEAEAKAKEKSAKISVEAGKALHEHGDALKSLIESLMLQRIELEHGAVAAEYAKNRLNGLSDAEARAAAGAGQYNKYLAERQRLTRESAESSGGLRSAYLAKLDEAGLGSGAIAGIDAAKTQTDVLVNSSNSYKSSIDAATESLKAQAEAVKAVGSQTAGVASISKAAASTTADVVGKLQALGWSRNQALGIAANLKKESEFRPGAVGDGGKAYGLAQWHPDRQANFQRAMGKSIQGSSVDDQLKFLTYEMTKGTEKGAGNRLKGAGSAAEAAAIVSRYYERPLAQAKEMQERAGIANGLAKSLGDKVPAFAKISADAGSIPATLTKAGEVTQKLTDVTVEYGGAIDSARVSQAEIYDLADDYMTEQANQLVRAAEDQRKRVELTGEAWRKAELIKQEFAPAEQQRILNAEQQLAYAEQLKTVEQERGEINQSLLVQYNKELEKTVLSEEQRADIVNKKIAASVEKITYETEQQVKMLRMTDDAWKEAELAVKGYNKAQIATIRAAQKHLEQVQQIHDIASEIGGAFQGALIDAFNETEGKFENFANSLTKTFEDLVLTPTIASFTEAFSQGIQGMLEGKANPFGDLKVAVSEAYGNIQAGGMQGALTSAGLASSASALLGGSQAQQIGAGIGSAAGNAIAVALGAAGPIGMALGAGIGHFAGGLFEDDDSPRAAFTGGNPKDGWRTGGGRKLYASSQLGTFGFQEDGTHDLGVEGETKLRDFIKQMAAVDNALVKFLPKAEIDRIKASLSNFTFRGTDFDKLFVERLKIISSGFEESFRSLIDFEAGADKVLQRIDDLVVMQQRLVPALSAMNLRIGTTAEQSLAAAAGLADTAGGLSQLQSATTYYMENFYSEVERKNITLKAAEATLAQWNNTLGLTGAAAIDTKEEFRQYIESLDLTTTVGQEAYNAAMGYADAIVSLTATMKSGMDTSKAWEDYLKNGTPVALAGYIKGNSAPLELNSLPKYATGTDYVLGDQAALIHSGEMIFSPKEADTLRSNVIDITARLANQRTENSALDLGAMLTELKALRQEVAALRNDSNQYNAIAVGQRSELNSDQRKLVKRVGYADTSLTGGYA